MVDNGQTISNWGGLQFSRWVCCVWACICHRWAFCNGKMACASRKFARPFFLAIYSFIKLTVNFKLNGQSFVSLLKCVHLGHISWAKKRVNESSLAWDIMNPDLSDIMTPFSLWSVSHHFIREYQNLSCHRYLFCRGSSTAVNVSSIWVRFRTLPSLQMLWIFGRQVVGSIVRIWKRMSENSIHPADKSHCLLMCACTHVWLVSLCF